MPVTISRTLQEIIKEVAEQDKHKELPTSATASTLTENMKIIEAKQNARVEFYLRAMIERLSVCSS